jgi:hypothetical protein
MNFDFNSILPPKNYKIGKEFYKRGHFLQGVFDTAFKRQNQTRKIDAQTRKKDCRYLQQWANTRRLYRKSARL